MCCVLVQAGAYSRGRDGDPNSHARTSGDFVRNKATLGLLKTALFSEHVKPFQRWPASLLLLIKCLPMMPSCSCSPEVKSEEAHIVQSMCR